MVSVNTLATCTMRRSTPCLRNAREKTMNKTVKVARYEGTRFWAVWFGDELIAVTVYKKGANRVAVLLEELKKLMGEC